MKLQLGVLHTDNQPAVTDDLASILCTFDKADFPVTGDLLAGPLAMAYRGHPITLEEDNETQPLCYGQSILTFDGRLDNRDAWITRLGLRSEIPRTDPFLVASAFDRVGEKLFPELIGEFALALWCKRTRTLFLVRSTCGSRPLYYVSRDDRIAWCSDFALLVKSYGGSLELDNEYMLRYLAARTDGRRTPFKHIQVVSPNTVLRFSNGVLFHEGKLWNPDDIAPVQFPRDEQYEEQCREELLEAVRLRLRARNTVFAELSGGFDSSTIVLIADQVHRIQLKPVETLQTFSCTYEESTTCDERQFIRAVEELRGIDSTYVHEDELHATLGLREIHFTGLPNANFCHPGRFEKYASVMKAYGARLLLTGIGGDHLFFNAPAGPLLVADQMWQRNVVQLHRECRRLSYLSSVPYLRLLFREALPLVLSSDSSRRSRFWQSTVPPWLARVQKTHLEELEHDDASKDGRLSPSYRFHRQAIQTLFSHLAVGHYQEYKDIYFTHPYSYRPLVEFCLGVALSQLARDGQPRSLMRRSLAQVLPTKILRRKSKASIDETFLRAIRCEWNDIGNIKQWQLCQRGFVEPGPLAQDLDKARMGINDGAGPLLHVFSLERWLRSLDDITPSTYRSNQYGHATK